MYTKRRHITAVVAALTIASSAIQPAFAAITLNGTVPLGPQGVVIIPPNKQVKSAGLLKFKFSAPTPGPYAFNFCIGPASNPCGLPTSYVVVVPGGEERLAVVDASFFKNKVLTVSQGTTNPLPFSVTIE